MKIKAVVHRDEQIGVIYYLWHQYVIAWIQNEKHWIAAKQRKVNTGFNYLLQTIKTEMKLSLRSHSCYTRLICVD